MQTLLMATQEKTDSGHRFTIFLSDQSDIEDFKFIAAWERKKMKELADTMIKGFISDWKSKNKGVKFPASGK